MANQIIHNGDSLSISADVSYISELHGYEVKLTNSQTGAVLFDDDQHVHDDHFSIRESWLDTFSAPATLNLLITVEIDHDGNEAKKEVVFHTD